MKLIRKYPGLITALILMLVYGLTAARTMTGFGDSDELIAAGYQWALPHPPGYPLLTSLIFLVTRLSFADPGQPAHLLGAAIMAASVGLVTQIGFELTKSRRWLAISGGLIVGSSLLVWEHGVHLEVFGLLSLLSLLFFWLGLNRRYLTAGVIAGLAIGHHPLAILTLAPQFLGQKKKGLVLAAGLVSIILTWTLLWFMGQAGSPDSWKFDASLSGLWHFVSRGDYSGFSPETGEMRSFISDVELSSIIASVSHYAVEMWRYWGISLLLGLLGIIYGNKIAGRSSKLVLISFLISGPVLAGYIAIPSYPVQSPEYAIGVAILERMYVLSQLWWGLLSLLGLVWLLERKWVKSWWLVGLSVVVMLNLIRLVPERSMSGYSAAKAYIESLFEGLAPDSGLICLSDLSCFGGYYYQAVLAKRNDVALISNAVQFRHLNKSAWRWGGFDYPDNPFRLGEAIGRATLVGKSIYVSQLNSTWTDELGLNGQAFFLIPSGDLSFRIERDQPANLIDTGRLTGFSRIDGPPYRYVEALRAVVAEQRLIDEYLRTQKLNPVTNASILTEINRCAQAGNLVCEVKAWQFLVWRNPDEAGYRQMFATGLRRAGLVELAEREAANAKSISATGAPNPDQIPE